MVKSHKAAVNPYIPVNKIIQKLYKMKRNCNLSPLEKRQIVNQRFTRMRMIEQINTPSFVIVYKK